MTHGEILSTWPYCLHFRLHLYHKSLSSENGRKISLVILFLHLSHSLLWPIILFLIKQHSGCHEIKIVCFFLHEDSDLYLKSIDILIMQTSKLLGLKIKIRHLLPVTSFVIVYIIFICVFIQLVVMKKVACVCTIMWPTHPGLSGQPMFGMPVEWLLLLQSLLLGVLLQNIKWHYLIKCNINWTKIYLSLVC